MRVIYAICLLMLLGIISSAQGGGVSIGVNDAQPVGGDYARGWLDSFYKDNPAPVTDSKVNNLWDWGNVPKGKTLVNGSLEPITNYTIAHISGEWLGERPFSEAVWYNSSAYAYTNDGAPLSPLYLSDDPWIRAQQLDSVIQTPRHFKW